MLNIFFFFYKNTIYFVIIETAKAHKYTHSHKQKCLECRLCLVDISISPYHWSTLFERREISSAGQVQGAFHKIALGKRGKLSESQPITRSLTSVLSARAPVSVSLSKQRLRLTVDLSSTSSRIRNCFRYFFFSYN